MIRGLSSVEATVRQFEQYCHRGLTLHIWSDRKQKSSGRTCLCPPSFYGNRCQYQNDRISLTLRFRTFSDSRQTLFLLLIQLIDDDYRRTIHSFHQLTYLHAQHCKTKFNMYLLYSVGTKNETKTYSIHIDIYEKISLAYRGSLLLAAKFPFLPVQRIATELNIPPTNEKMENCISERCVHGRCIQYSNMKAGITFCHCNEGWSGKDCTIPHRCTCSVGSLCVGLLPNNRSLCVCPTHRWGPQCLLPNMICENESCLNGGKCISMDENIISEKRFLCICIEGFSGDRCELADAKLILSFDEHIPLPQYILVHFIEVIHHAAVENGSTYKMIPANQNSVTVYRSHPYHIAFIQSYDNYYLVTVQKRFNRSQTILRTITTSDRCQYINEVLNETIVQFHLLRRIKYYHLPCQNRSSKLSCFYDDTHFCLCYDFGLQRLANCFEFDYRRKFDCYGESNCQNGAQCLQDRHTCPQTSVCVCPTCYYGKLCQFSSNLFGLSLDAILGYSIQPHTSIRHQPSIVQTGAALTIIMTLTGLVNGILSLMTFRSKETCQTGCGFYLFTASIVTLFTMIIFALKFFILLIAQITYIKNRAFLLMQCYSMDFFLQIGLNMDRWMGACVAVERTVVSIQGTKFNKNKSKQLAKYIIFTFLFFITGAHLSDPIHRSLIDDNDNNEQRIWCILKYSPDLHIFNSVINLTHFFLPLFINFVSPLIIIRMQIQQRLTVQSDQSYGQIFCEQCHRYYHLLIASVVLVILAAPRMIISFISSCLTSSGSNGWLFLAGYFISFVPLILHFLLFVLPSKGVSTRISKTNQRISPNASKTITTHLIKHFSF